MYKNIIILTDFLGFLRRDNHQCSSLNLNRIVKILESNGFYCNTLSFKDIAARDNVIKNCFIWYTSSEFPSYKNYIEDILLSLDKSNILIPHFDFIRAHNNKGYQALIRKRYGISDLDSIYIGTLEELYSLKHEINFPVVLKTVIGSGSKGVKLIKNFSELGKIIKRQSRSKNYLSKFAKKILKRYVFKGRYDYENSLESLHYYNFILQRFIPGLKDDWKILVFYDNFYVLKRGIRKGDFRASGSGKFSYDEFNVNVLDFCEQIKKKFNVPWLSLDVGFDGKKCYLFEYQMLHFGPIAFKKSKYFYKKEKRDWKKVKQKSNLSEVYAKAFVKYIKENY